MCSGVSMKKNVSAFRHPFRCWVVYPIGSAVRAVSAEFFSFPSLGGLGSSFGVYVSTCSNARAPIVRNIFKFASFLRNALCGALLTRNAAVKNFPPRGTSETRRPRLNTEPSRSAYGRRALKPRFVEGIGRRKFLAYARVETVLFKMFGFVFRASVAAETLDAQAHWNG